MLKSRVILERKKKNNFRNQLYKLNPIENLQKVFYKSHQNVQITVYVFEIKHNYVAKVHYLLQ